MIVRPNTMSVAAQDAGPSLFDEGGDEPKATVIKKRKNQTTTVDGKPVKKNKTKTSTAKEKKPRPKKTLKAPPTASAGNGFEDPTREDDAADEVLEEVKKVLDGGAGPGSHEDDLGPDKEFKVPAQLLPPPKEMDFVITIPYPQPFKNKVDIMSKVIQDCDFSVVATPNFCGLCVDSVDERNCCMIISRFACDTKVRGIHHFCVKLSVFNTLLKMVAPKRCVEIFRKVGESDVKMVVYDPNDQSSYQEYTIPTLDREPEEDTIGKFNSDYTIEIELNEFRGLVKMAKDLKAEDLTFQILEPRDKGAVRTSYFILSIDGDAKCRTVYSSVTEWNSGVTAENNDENDQAVENQAKSVVIKTADRCVSGHARLPGMHTLKVCLEERFSILYLTNFLASMKRNMLTIRLSSTGDPMVLFHPLGSESFVSFVLAPKNRDEDGGSAVKPENSTEVDGPEP